MFKDGFRKPIDFLEGVVAGMSDLFVPYFKMSISFIQCAKKLLTGKELDLGFWLRLIVF